MPSRGQVVDQRVVGSRCARLYWFCTQTISADPAPFRDLRGSDVAQPDVAHQALPLELGQRRERRLDRPLGRAMHVEHDAQIDHVEHVEAEIAQIVVHRLRQFFAREGRDP